MLSSLFVRGDPAVLDVRRLAGLVDRGARVICGMRTRVTGMENLPRLGRRVLLAKHQSTWETFLMPTLMPHPLAYVFKKELLYVPFFGWAMARLDMIHIDRSQRTQAFNKVAEQGATLLEQGIWIIMFPEGTRTPRGSRATTRAAARGLPARPACR